MRGRPLPVLVFAAVVAAAQALWLPVDALAQGGAPQMRQAPGGVRVQLFPDQRRIASAKRAVGGPGDFSAWGYRLRPASDRIELVLESDEILRRWKGGFVLGQPVRDAFESDSQLLPAMLVVDVINESGAAKQVATAYLDVAESITDAEPFLELTTFESEIFDLRNYGWGRAENAVLSFAFGPNRPATETFTLSLGSLGATEVNPIRAMAALVPAIARLQQQPPPCPSVQMIRACLNQLARVVNLGRLGEIAYLRNDNLIRTRLIGTLSYQWRDGAAGARRRNAPVDVELVMFRFDTGDAPERGAAAPEEGGFRPIVLPLDRARYRVPLPYRPRMGPGENRRFELTLSSTKSSRHLFQVVMEMTDGSRAVSPPIDFLYFKPRLDVGETRQVR